jgi:AcrR family transcriptional regulator
MITAAAGVNLAAVNYHFGSKEALIGEVFARLIDPINRERLEHLDRIEAAHPEGPIPLEEVVDAFITPPLLKWKRLGSTALRFFGRTYAESDALAPNIFKEQFGEVIRRFAAAFQRALPELDPPDLLWRLQFAVGAMVHTMLAHDHLKSVFGEMLESSGIDDLKERLATFITAGMRAPAAAGQRERER